MKFLLKNLSFLMLFQAFQAQAMDLIQNFGKDIQEHILELDMVKARLDKIEIGSKKRNEAQLLIERNRENVVGNSKLSSIATAIPLDKIGKEQNAEHPLIEFNCDDAEQEIKSLIKKIAAGLLLAGGVFCIAKYTNIPTNFFTKIKNSLPQLGIMSLFGFGSAQVIPATDYGIEHLEELVSGQGDLQIHDSAFVEETVNHVEEVMPADEIVNNYSEMESLKAIAAENDDVIFGQEQSYAEMGEEHSEEVLLESVFPVHDKSLADSSVLYINNGDNQAEMLTGMPANEPALDDYGSHIKTLHVQGYDYDVSDLNIRPNKIG